MILLFSSVALLTIWIIPNFPPRPNVRFWGPTRSDEAVSQLKKALKKAVRRLSEAVEAPSLALFPARWLRLVMISRCLFIWSFRSNFLSIIVYFFDGIVCLALPPILSKQKYNFSILSVALIEHFLEGILCLLLYVVHKSRYI